MIRRIIFWQNILSDHQSDFISRLSELSEAEVYLAYESDASRGWSETNFHGTTVLDSRNPDSFLLLLSFTRLDDCHVFSGFNVYPKCTQAYNILRSYNVRISVISEAFDPSGPLGIFRSLRAHFIYRFLNRRVNAVFAIGSDSRRQFISHGISSSKIVDFAYYLKPDPKTTPPLASPEDPFHIVFIGQLIPRKNVLLLVRAFTLFYRSYPNSCLTIVGIGRLKTRVLNYLRNNPLIPCRLVCGLPHSDVLQLLANASALVLPSRWDGWGAVVSESLLVNTPVVCSNKVGSRILITSPERGSIFDDNSIQSLLSSLVAMYERSQSRASTSDFAASDDQLIQLDSGVLTFLQHLEQAR